MCMFVARDFAAERGCVGLGHVERVEIGMFWMEQKWAGEGLGIRGADGCDI